MGIGYTLTLLMRRLRVGTKCHQPRPPASPCRVMVIFLTKSHLRQQFGKTDFFASKYSDSFS
jgi:hypothetical protein